MMDLECIHDGDSYRTPDLFHFNDRENLSHVRSFPS